MAIVEQPAQGEASHSGNRERPTVCQVLHSLTVGGAEVLAYRLANQLHDRFRFVFACLDDLGELGERLRGEGFQVEVIGRKPGLDTSCMRRLAAYVREQSVDLIHAHQYTPFFYSVAPGIFRRRPPILFTEHGRFHPDYPRRKRIWFNRLALRKEDRVVAVGKSVRQALIDNEGIAGERVQVIYNGVELPDFGHDDEVRRAVRAELSIPEDRPLLIQVARLDHLKDHGTAVASMQRIVQRRPDVQLLLVGDGPERSHIEKEISEWNLSDHVRLLGTRQDVPRLLSAADLFLLTSISEGIPVTLIEAMAAQLPIVGTDVGGMSEVVVHGETGLLAPSGDAPKIAECVLELLDSPQRCAEMGQSGQQRAWAFFTESQMHRSYATAYTEMTHA